MRITCPTCETSYNLAEDAMGAGGRKVRCTRCGAVWHARPEPPEPVPADEATAEAEWSAVEEAGAAGPPEPADDDWRAALDEPDETEAARAADAPAEDGADAAGVGDGTVGAETAEGTDGEAPSGPSAGAWLDDAGDAPPPDGTAAPEPAAGVPATIEAEPAGFAGRRAAARGRRGRSGPARSANRRIGTRIAGGVVVALASVTLTGLLAGSLFAREAVVRRVPDLAGLYAALGLGVNLRGLEFRDFRSHREIEGATPVLVVEGTIENVSDGARPIPRLRFGLRSTMGREVYAWTMDPSTDVLDPGRSTTFRSRLPTPPEAAADVQVRFTDRKGP